MAAHHTERAKEQLYEPLACGEERLSHSTDGQESADASLLGYPRRSSSKSSQAGWKALALTNTVLLVAVLALVATGRNVAQCAERECAAVTSNYSPLLEDGVIEYEDVKFHGALEQHSPYAGYPSKELDEAWKYLTHDNYSGVEGSIVDRIGKSRTTAVKYPEEEGGQFFVGIEVFHQLHCVNLVRMYTYREYYDLPENRPNSFTDSESTLRMHIDHCIEMLRQAIMCQGDVGIVTYNWVKKWGLYPDFSTNHRCRKFDKIVQWAESHPLPVENGRTKDPVQMEGTVVLDEPPQ